MDDSHASGILSEVDFYLKEKKVEYEVIDKCPPDPPNLKDIVVEPGIFSEVREGFKLHDYQVSIANKAIQSKRGIIKCATGGGKTVIFASILKQLQDNNLANKTLVDQTYKVLKECGVKNVGRLNMDYNEPDKITCTTIQSIHKYPYDTSSVKTLIVDEVHEFASKQSIEAIKAFNNTQWRLGFSATPFKKDDILHNYKLKAWFGPQLCDVTVEELQEKNILAGNNHDAMINFIDSVAHFYPITQPTLTNMNWADAEEHGIHQNDYFHQMVAKLVSRIPTGRILILVKRLTHGDRLAELIPGSYWIKGEDNAATRNHVLEELRHNNKRKVVAIFSPVGYVGLDIFVHHLINCCGGKDPNLTIQKVGRGLRKAKDKDSVEYYDFMFTNNKYLKAHSKERYATLETEGHKIINEGPIDMFIEEEEEPKQPLQTEEEETPKINAKKKSTRRKQKETK